jgi:hypothetical protein
MTLEPLQWEEPYGSMALWRREAYNASTHELMMGPNGDDEEHQRC